MSAIIEVTEHLTVEEHAFIEGHLNHFNEQQTSMMHARPLAVLIKDVDGGKLLGGLIGRTSLGVLFIDLVFVPENLRSRGLGTQLVEGAEDEARKRDCKHALLYTLTFQAPDFYRRLGYRAFETIPCDPPRYQRVFMRKEL